MAKFGWFAFPQSDTSPVSSSDRLASPFDPDRKVAPHGVDEIDFDQRIAHWEALVSAPHGDEENDGANDN